MGKYQKYEVLFLIYSSFLFYTKLSQIHFSFGLCMYIAPEWLICLNTAKPTTCHILSEDYLHCRLLVIFTKRLNLDQARHNVEPDLRPNCLNPKKNFLKAFNFERNQQMAKKMEKIPSVCTDNWPPAARSTTYLPCRNSLKATSYQRQCDVMTSHWRRCDVVLTSCAGCLWSKYVGDLSILSMPGYVVCKFHEW